MGSLDFFDRNFDDALRLMTEARTYIAYGEPGDMERLPPAAQLRISYDVMRVTASLLRTLGRLLAAEAARQEGTALEPCETAAMASAGEGRELVGMDEEWVPRGLTNLLERSRRLSERVARVQARN